VIDRRDETSSPPYRFAALPDGFQNGKPQRAMGEDEEKRNKAGGWLMAVGLLLVVYVSSSGPALKWQRTHPGTHYALNRFYAPIKLLWHTPVSLPLDCYHQWWIR
jgi:hypothetical protein